MVPVKISNIFKNLVTHSFLVLYLTTQSYYLSTASAESSDLTECYEVYILKKGDTFKKIAKARRARYKKKFPLTGVDWMSAKIAALNPQFVNHPEFMQPGMEILLPQEISKPVSELNPGNDPTSIHSRCFKSMTQNESSSATRNPSSIIPPRYEAQESDREKKEEEGEGEENRPGKWKLTAGAAAVKTSDSSYFPVLALEGGIALGRGFSVITAVEGYRATYDDGVTPAFSLLQAQFRAGLEYQVSDAFWIGAGYRYFTFGYTVPASTSAHSNDATVSAGIHGAIFKNAEWETLVNLRETLSIQSSASGTFNGCPQFAGFGVESTVLFRLNRLFYFGPYLFLDYTQINLSQSGSTTGSPTFSDTGIGGGLHFGFSL